MSKRIMDGVVVSNKMIKTLVVKVDRYVKHPIYKKFIKSSKKYMAHYDEGVYNEGDAVKLIESRPISKNKKWRVI